MTLFHMVNICGFEQHSCTITMEFRCLGCAYCSASGTKWSHKCKWQHPSLASLLYGGGKLQFNVPHNPANTFWSILVQLLSERLLAWLLKVRVKFKKPKNSQSKARCLLAPIQSTQVIMFHVCQGWHRLITFMVLVSSGSSTPQPDRAVTVLTLCICFCRFNSKMRFPLLFPSSLLAPVIWTVRLFHSFMWLHCLRFQESFGEVILSSPVALD